MNRPFKKPRRKQFEILTDYSMKSNRCYWETVWASDIDDAILQSGGRMHTLYGIDAIVAKRKQQEFYDELAEALA